MSAKGAHLVSQSPTTETKRDLPLGWEPRGYQAGLWEALQKGAFRRRFTPTAKCDWSRLGSKSGFRSLNLTAASCDSASASSRSAMKTS